MLPSRYQPLDKNLPGLRRDLAIAAELAIKKPIFSVLECMLWAGMDAVMVHELAPLYEDFLDCERQHYAHSTQPAGNARATYFLLLIEASKP